MLHSEVEYKQAENNKSRLGGRAIRAGAGFIIGGMLGEVGEFLVLLLDGRRIDDHIPIPFWMIPAGICLIGSLAYDYHKNTQPRPSQNGIYSRKDLETQLSVPLAADNNRQEIVPLLGR